MDRLKKLTKITVRAEVEAVLLALTGLPATMTGKAVLELPKED